MERMNNKDYRAWYEDELNEKIKQLEEENKELKEHKENLIRADKKKSDHIDELEKEIEELKRCWGIEIETCNRYREKCEELEEENKVIKEEKEMLIKQNTLLQESNKKLKSDLEECECSFGFENDEVGFWKGEYKRLKKWIKDHCKGYGNLFPEDEMKRQWKKADKKRK